VHWPQSSHPRTDHRKEHGKWTPVLQTVDEGRMAIVSNGILNHSHQRTRHARQWPAGRHFDPEHPVGAT